MVHSTAFHPFPMLVSHACVIGPVIKIAEMVKELRDIHTKLSLAQRKPIPKVPKLKMEEVPKK